MDKLIFYYILWISWIVVTFFFSKSNKNRFKLAVFILVIILSSSISISIDKYSINTTTIILTVVSLVYIMTKRQIDKIMLLTSAFIICISSVAVRLYILYEPAVTLYNDAVIIALIIIMISIILHKHISDRIVAILLGLSQGEILYVVVLNDIFELTEIGTTQYLNNIAIIISCLIIIFIFSKGIRSNALFLEKDTNY